MVAVSPILSIILFLGVAILAGILYMQSSTPLTTLTEGVKCDDLGLTYNLDPSKAMMKYTAYASFTREGEHRRLTIDYTILVLNNVCEGKAVVYGQLDAVDGDKSLLDVLTRFTLTNFQLPQTIPVTSYYYVIPIEAVESVDFNESISTSGYVVRPSYGLQNTATQDLGNGFKEYTSIKWRFDKRTGVLLELSITDKIVDASGVERQHIDVSIKHKSLYLLDNETQLYINPQPLAWSASLSLTIFGASIILGVITVINRIFA